MSRSWKTLCITVNGPWHFPTHAVVQQSVWYPVSHNNYKTCTSAARGQEHTPDNKQFEFNTLFTIKQWPSKCFITILKLVWNTVAERCSSVWLRNNFFQNNLDLLSNCCVLTDNKALNAETNTQYEKHQRLHSFKKMYQSKLQCTKQTFSLQTVKCNTAVTSTLL